MDFITIDFETATKKPESAVIFGKIKVSYFEGEHIYRYY